LSYDEVIPARIDNKETDVIEAGVIEAKDAPVPGGSGVGHYNVTCGTGWWGKKQGEWVLCSNNHVLANENRCHVGDAILYPCKAAGGTLDDTIAKLLTWIPLVGFDEPPEPPPPEPPSDCPIARLVVDAFNANAGFLGRKTRLRAVVPFKNLTEPVNIVDGAIARPLNPSIVDPAIKEIGTVDEFIEALVDMKIKKYGWRSALTRGDVAMIDATAKVQYHGGVLIFEHQGVTKQSICVGGDSGSLIVTDEAKARGVGVLFAGSNTLTIFNHYRDYRGALQLDK